MSEPDVMHLMNEMTKLVRRFFIANAKNDDLAYCAESTVE